MRLLERIARTVILTAVFALAAAFAVRFGTGGLWKGLGAAHAGTAQDSKETAYDLTQLSAVNETLDTIRKKYVDPSRVKPRQMFLSALDQVQKEVAPVIVWHDENSPSVRVRVDTEEKEFRVDNVQGPWDVSARLREVFAFLQSNLKESDVDLREVEYAACNGMLRTLDPHSVFLSPDAFAEMNLSTSGHFGGLGIVISIRDQMLTIMRPMPDTPAGRSGLRRLDRITKINNESTLNMPLDDAVKRLRGKPGSKVTIWVHRDGNKGWSGAKPFELVREEIRIKSVMSESLAPGIGYVRIKQFQQSTSDELDAALEELHKKKLTGLVLDLRDNPGGLLDQAARVADKFLERGVIVSTVGGSEGREEKRAKARGTEPRYPMVVLTNASSASASEIVSGALKHQDRAVVVGQTTFGKGTVQLVFPRIAGDAALKLTIAEYLTPGDVSIQGVGVAPDIELDRMTADPLEMDLFRSAHRPRERDLTNSLINGTAQRGEQSWMTLRYNLSQSQRLAMFERGGEMDDEFRMDFPIEFARDLVAKMPPGQRMDELRAVKSFLDTAQDEQIRAVSADLKKLGIDWSPSPEGRKKGAQSGDFDVTVSTSAKGNEVRAGDPLDLIVSVKNKGKEPIYQLRAITKSDSGYYDEKELIFGKIEPGETKKAKAALGWCDTEGRTPGSTKPAPQDSRRVCTLPKNAVTRQDVVKVRFRAAAPDEPPSDAEIRPTVRSLPQPVFAYDYQVVDDRPGNGDGMVARGEGVTVYLTVKNVGKGKSNETQANLGNATGDGLLLKAGRFDVSNMAPGDTRQVAFTFDVLDTLRQNLIKVDLSVADRDLGVVSSEKLSIPVASQGLTIEPLALRAITKQVTAVRSRPLDEARVVGSIPAGTSVEVVGRHASFYKVGLGPTRFGFVAADDMRESRSGGSPLAFSSALSHSPPQVDLSSAGLSTRESRIKISATATDTNLVLDSYVFVGSRKVFYQSNRKSGSPLEMKFSLDVDLNPGVNVIHVVARESEDTASRRTLVVRRDGPKGEALPTPDSELFGADWEFSGEP